MKKKIDITKILYSVKHINDLYYSLSVYTATECEITKAEVDILAFLNNNPTCDTAKDIVKLKGFSKAYVSKAVEALLNKKLITIYVDKNDRRYQHLKLTEKSKPLVNKIYKMQCEFVNKITDGIPKNEIQTYLKVLESFSKNALK